MTSDVVQYNQWLIFDLKWHQLLVGVEWNKWPSASLPYTILYFKFFFTRNEIPVTPEDSSMPSKVEFTVNEATEDACST